MKGCFRKLLCSLEFSGISK